VVYAADIFTVEFAIITTLDLKYTCDTITLFGTDQFFLICSDYHDANPVIFVLIEYSNQQFNIVNHASFPASSGNFTVSTVFASNGVIYLTASASESYSLFELTVQSLTLKKIGDIPTTAQSDILINGCFSRSELFCCFLFYAIRITFGQIFSASFKAN